MAKPPGLIKINYSLLVSYPKLVAAYHSCRQHKQHSVNALIFKNQLFKNLATLRQNLKNYQYFPTKSICFAVSYPKLREIFAADFKDRVVHHLLVNQLEPRFEKQFVFHSFACRKYKGGHVAANYLSHFLQQLTKNFSQPGFYQQLDISNFFARIDKPTLNTILKQHIQRYYNCEPVKQKQLLWLTKIIINHDPTSNYHLNGSEQLHAKVPKHKSLFNQPKSKGLPIGNLTSQFFANVYLNQLDQFCKRQLKIKYYLRYADDVVMLSQDKQQLQYWQENIKEFLQAKLKLKLNPTKTKLASIYQGVDFVGYLVKPHRIYVRNKTVKQVKTILYNFNQGMLWVHNHQRQEAVALKAKPTSEQIKYLQAALNSYYGHFRQADSLNLRKHLFHQHFGTLKKYLKPVNNYQHFVIKKLQ
jgi:retron-type reverse transcriptase